MDDQELDIQGSAGDNYVVGGWCRAWAAPSGEGRTFRLRVRFQKNNGLWVDGGTADWNEEWVDWQYACGAAIAPADYRKIHVSIDYDANVNEAQIGAVSLVKEYYGQTYAYDDKNNITAVSTLLGEKSNAEYDSFDNLTNYVQPGRAKTDKYLFAYGETDAEKKRHLPLRSETPLGIVTNMEYDAFGNATRSRTGSKTSEMFVQATTTYTDDGNYPVSTRDARGNAQSSVIDPNLGLTSSMTDSRGQTVHHAYDTANRLVQTYVDVENGRSQNAYTYSQDRLAAVTHNTDSDAAHDVTYSFGYDPLGNPTTAKVGAQLLSTNVYSATGDKLLKEVVYGNGGKVSYTHDSFKRVVGVRHDNSEAPRFTYEYGANGNLGRVKDTVLMREERSSYDGAGRPVEGEQYENGSLRYRLTQSYDRFEQPTVLHERLEKPDDSRSEYTMTATYDKEGKPASLTYETADVATNQRLEYDYDELGRVTKRNLFMDAASESATLGTDYTYVHGGYGNHSTTQLVRELRQMNGTYTYWYDTTGNLTHERWQGSVAGGGDLRFEDKALTCNGALTLETNNVTAVYHTTYAYDTLGQLIRVNDQRQNATWVYGYDLGGNLLTKKRYAYTEATDLTNATALETIPYIYGDANWRDKLTSYNGKAIVYDAIGNPLSYDGRTFTWKAGRQLHSIVSAAEGLNAEYVYGHSGLRVKKIVGGVETSYTLNGKNITHVKQGSNELHFCYDAQGRPAIAEYNGAKYAYTVPRTRVIIPGSLNGETGFFEYIIESTNVVNHRLFVPKR